MSERSANFRRVAFALGLAGAMVGAAYYVSRREVDVAGPAVPVPQDEVAQVQPVVTAPEVVESGAVSEPAVEVAKTPAAPVAEPNSQPEIVVEAVEAEASETSEPEVADLTDVEVAAVEPPEAGALVAEVPVAEEAGVADAEIAGVEPEISNAAPDALAMLDDGPAAPGVDVVRVAPDGQALVAGTAAPGALVGIYADRDRIAEVKADQSGNFVAIFQAEPSAEAQTLTVEATAPDGLAIVSEDVVVLLPATEAAVGTPAAAGRAVQGAVAEPEREIAADLSGMAQEAVVASVVEDQTGPAEESPEEPASDVSRETEAEPEDDQAPRVAATAIVRDGVAQVVPLARPAGVQSRDITLASISYVDGGLVTLAGFGVAGADLRAYVDDAFSRAGDVDQGGRWAIELGEVAVGVHRIRIDQLGPDGKVASRVETPFKRDAPKPSEPVPEGQVRPVSVVVQPGSNLWTLARIHYGSGVLYTQIFNANSDLIRDPELIYPGQVFDLPEPGE